MNKISSHTESQTLTRSRPTTPPRGPSCRNGLAFAASGTEVHRVHHELQKYPFRCMHEPIRKGRTAGPPPQSKGGAMVPWGGSRCGRPSPMKYLAPMEYLEILTSIMPFFRPGLAQPPQKGLFGTFLGSNLPSKRLLSLGVKFRSVRPNFKRCLGVARPFYP